MRDLRKIRSKHEIRLDNRQIALIAAGGLVVLIVVFALGVVVGKGLGRIEGMNEAFAPDAVEGKSDDSLPPEVQLLAQDERPPDAPSPVVDETPERDYIPGPANGDMREVPLPPPGQAPTPTPEPTPDPLGLPPPDEDASDGVDAGSDETTGDEDIAVLQDNLTPGEGGFYTVQVAAYPTKFEADSMKSKLEKKGLKPYIVKVDIPGKGVWFRVRVGKFKSKDGAQSMAGAIKKKEGVTPFVAYVK